MDYDDFDYPDYNESCFSNKKLMAELAEIKKSPYYPFYLICTGYDFFKTNISKYEDDYIVGYACILNPDEWRHHWELAIYFCTPEDYDPNNTLYGAYIDMTNKFSMEEIISYANTAVNYISEAYKNTNSDLYKRIRNSSIAFSRAHGYESEGALYYELIEIFEVLDRLKSYCDWYEYLNI